MMLILCGQSGSGKDAVSKVLLEKYPETVKMYPSTTSRPIREGEVEGREYYFTTKENFLKAVEENQFLEYRSYHTTVNGVPDEWYYGTSKFEKTNDDTLLIVIKDLKGAKLLKEYCEEIGEPCECVLLTVDDKIREERAKLRGSFDQTEWDRRLKTDEADFAYENQVGVVDYTVNNDGENELDAIAEFCFYAATHPSKEEEIEEI